MTEPAFPAIQIEASDPRLRIMISSTTFDLPQHRHEVSEAILREGHTVVKMEYGSAEWNSDAIKFSLEKVEQSQVYLGIFALRYGHIPEDSTRNPERLSITEMEYRHALKLGIPTLIFLSHKDHPFTEEEIDFDEEKRTKLKLLRSRLQTSEICGFFDSPDKLRQEVYVALHRLQVRLTQSNAPMAPVATKSPLPRPPQRYAVPEYTLTHTFVGRASELAEFDTWAKSTETVMVVEGIGGLGKSAVTWEWVIRWADSAIPGLAGCVWWSFYEKGTTLVAFVRHALA